MLSPLICGSFNHQQEEDDRDSLSSNSPCSTPRKSRKSNKDSKNPYSTRGLDKFSALLAELEEKRQKIYSQVGSQDISFVRFVYSSSNEVVPIVVKLKDQNKAKDEIKDKPRTSSASETSDKLPVEASTAADDQQTNEQPRVQIDKKTEDKKKVTWNLKLNKWRRPSFYMPIFIILILLFLAFFGRSVAILCTSIGWYIVPTLSSKRPSPKLAKKKQLVRRLSEISPRTRNIDDPKGKSPHGRQNSF
ncbi:uncharacterized protein LOC8265292 [Ricinus communis]|uniref:ZCF37 n=1 Tax=Ricinus communis TaxID=3988 RepID=B9R6Z7_RICCO|nr:uncharacterized protein LOC8265292 [Ricinus communis]EEF52277.1 conserved hypothetical protein [Ricinus communis]|eukprot:XP_002510090.1 uncharacterized protein LOC8265292 [Ricinus communis]